MATAALKNQRQDQQKYEVVDKRRFHPDKFVHSSLFSEVYVLKDLPLEQSNIWENYQSKHYFEFFDRLLEIMKSFGPQEAEKWNHSQTNENLVFPMLEALGWGNIQSKNNSFLENHSISFPVSDGSIIGLRPSILICEDEGGKNFIKNAKQEDALKELKRYLKVPVVTSYYSACHDRRASKYDHKKDEIGKRGDVYSNLGPDNQVLEYLNILDVPWGIFTDGSTWRLYRKEAASDGKKYFEFDFSELYNLYRTSPSEAKSEQSEFFEIAKYLYWFFSKETIVHTKPIIPFIETIFDKSQQYVERIKEDLKEKYVHAMTIACNGYLNDIRNKKKSVDIKLIAKTAESFIFNLIFIRSCESKRVFPIEPAYLSISLKTLIDKIRHFSASDSSTDLVRQSLSDFFKCKIKDEGSEIYLHLQNLFNVIEKGNHSLKVSGFLETVFYPDEKELYQKYLISNKEMIRIIFLLFYDYIDQRKAQVPFGVITPRQLGSIYESFLEFQPAIASSKMFYKKRISKGKTFWQWVENDDHSDSESRHFTCVDKGDIFFSPNNLERKSTGSYYTPDNIVNYVVKEVLEPLCVNKSKEELLKIKVCDPAMGSGHFLFGVMDYISKKIAQQKHVIDFNLTEIRREVLDSCIFGADINSSAVKLGKMSFWLATALPGKKLERLSDQLKVTNSLYMENFAEELWPHVSFSAFVGNPPWGAKTFDSAEFKSPAFKKLSLKNINIFELFLRLSLESINKKNGRIGLLIPRNFIRGEDYAAIRSTVLPLLEKIVETGQFPGVTQEACAPIIDSKTTESFLIDNYVKNGLSEQVKVSKNKVQKPLYTFLVNQSDDFDDIVSLLLKGKPLKEFYKIQRGIECGKNGELIKCPSCGTHTSPPKKKNKEGEFKKICDCGEVLNLKNKIFNMISETQTKGSVPILAGSDIHSRSFDVKRYVKLGLSGVDYKPDLAFGGSKIYIPKNNDKIVAAYDPKGGIYLTQTLYVGTPKGKSLPHKKIVSILNSKLMRFFYEYTVNNGGKLTNAITVSVLESIPVFIDSNVDKYLDDEAIYQLYGLNMQQIERVDFFVSGLSVESSRKNDIDDD